MNKTLKAKLIEVIKWIVYYFTDDNLGLLLMETTYKAVKPAVAIYVYGSMLKDSLTGLETHWNWKQLTTYSQQSKKQRTTTSF